MTYRDLVVRCGRLAAFAWLGCEAEKSDDHADRSGLILLAEPVQERASVICQADSRIWLEGPLKPGDDLLVEAVAVAFRCSL